MRITKFYLGRWHIRINNDGLYWYVWPSWLHRILDRLVVRYVWRLREWT